MTDNVVSFKRAKKRKGYAKKEMKAAENRKKFGRTKSEKRLDEFEADYATQHMDNHELEE